jgi:hypothetical protein
MQQSNAQRADEGETTEQKPGTKPVGNVRYQGVEATIWNNPTEKGDFYNVTFQRRYLDKDQQWQTSHSYGPGDVLALAKVADMAATRIIELQEEKRQGRARWHHRLECYPPDGAQRSRIPVRTSAIPWTAAPGFLSTSSFGCWCRRADTQVSTRMEQRRVPESPAVLPVPVTFGSRLPTSIGIPLKVQAPR